MIIHNDKKKPHLSTNRDLQIARRLVALSDAAGAWSDADHPELAGGAAQHVAALRGEDEVRFEREVKHKRESITDQPAPLDAIGEQARRNGSDQLTMREIDAEIAAARRERLESLILDAIQSGEAAPLTHADFEQIKKRGLKRLCKTKPK